MQYYYDTWFSVLFLIIAALLFALSTTAMFQFFEELLTVTPVPFSEVAVTKVKPAFVNAQLKLFSPSLLFCIYHVGFHLLFYGSSTVVWDTTFPMCCCFWIPWIILKPHQTLSPHCSASFYRTFRKTFNKCWVLQHSPRSVKIGHLFALFHFVFLPFTNAICFQFSGTVPVFGRYWKSTYVIRSSSKMLEHSLLDLLFKNVSALVSVALYTCELTFWNWKWYRDYSLA